jgi:hypothetical protein
MSKPVILLDAGQLVGLSGSTAGDVLTWNGTAWVSSPGGSTGTVTSVTAGAGLSGGTITTSGTISMPNVGTAGSYGSASSVAVLTTDAQGRVSGATTTTIEVAQSQVTGLVTDLAAKADKSVTATAGTGLTGGGTLGANFSFALDTVGAAASNQGSASKTVTISTDAYGRVTALSEQDIGSLPASAISSGQLSLSQGGTGINASGVTGGQVLVGGTGVLALQSVSGDASLASNGAMTVTRLQGNAVSATMLGAPDAGKALVWSGSEWQASTIQGGGGGGGLTFFMNYAASSPYPMSPQFDENAGWDTGAITVANDENGTALGTFVTAVGTPAIEVIPAGLWDVNFYAQSSDGVNSTAVRVKVATLAGATQTVIATSDWVYLSDPSAVVQYPASVYVPATDVALTDRVEIIFEGRRFVSPAQTITLHFGTDSITHAHTTINAPGGTGLVKVVDGFLQSPATLLVNADVASDAAIAVSKLEAGTNDYFLSTVAGVPTWAALPSSGVASLAGTADQVLVGGTSGSPQTGALTLTLPQSIASTSSPTFAGLTLDTFSGLLRATAGVLSGGASVSLTGEVTGTLPILNGGTNLTSSGATGNLLVSDGSAWSSAAMSGDATIASTGAITLKNTGTAGTYGSASAVPVITTDAQGRVTGVTNTSISISASAITTGVLGAANGGTGQSSYAVGDLLYATGTTELSRLADVVTGRALLSGGVGAAPFWGQVGLTTHVTGTLPVANGGTGVTSLTSNALLVGGATVGALSGSALGQVATWNGTQWTAAAPATSGTVTSVSSSTTLSGLTLSTATGTTTPVLSLTGTLGVASGGTGATTLTGYVKGSGTAALTASSTIPASDVTGLAGIYAPLASPTFTGTVTIPAGASISGFAPLASPTFSGTPSLPTGTTGVTQGGGDNTTALATTAFVTTAVATAAGTPYDLPAEIPGTPATSTKVVNFKAVRSFILAATGHQGGQLTAPSGDFICTVRKNATTLGTITFAAGGFSSSITGTLVDRTFAATDVLSVETPSAALGIDTPFFTLSMTLA